MQVLIARMNHETNTFSPVPTPFEAFAPAYGEAAYRQNKGGRTAMSAFIDLSEKAGVKLITPVSAFANPGGRVAAEAYQALCDGIVSAADSCDALLLDLHGAMACENTDDGEGDLLERLRQRYPGVPIAVALDLHGNVTQKMVDNSDVIISFKTYPHVDMYEAGEHAGRLLFDWLLRGAPKPKLVWQRLPLITHTLRSTSESGAMQQAIQTARALEVDGVSGVSVLAGFALADIAYPCISVVAVGSGEEGYSQAQQVVKRLAEQIWASREGFVYQAEPLSQSLARALAAAKNADKPILLIDHGDNCMSGGTCDTMDVLMAALAAGLNSLMAGLICDPVAVLQMAQAGIGATLELPIGNQCAIPSIGRAANPVMLRGTIRAISDGKYVITGPTYTGQTASMGKSAVFDTGKAQLVITSMPHEPWDLGTFASLGLKPEQARFILLKSRMYCRPVFGPLCAALIECDSPGVTSAEFSLFHYQNRSRPLYPFEAVDWR